MQALDTFTGNHRDNIRGVKPDAEEFDASRTLSYVSLQNGANKGLRYAPVSHRFQNCGFCQFRKDDHEGNRVAWQAENPASAFHSANGRTAGMRASVLAAKPSCELSSVPARLSVEQEGYVVLA
jgi:hypothetical protein